MAGGFRISQMVGGFRISQMAGGFRNSHTVGRGIQDFTDGGEGDSGFHRWWGAIQDFTDGRGIQDFTDGGGIQDFTDGGGGIQDFTDGGGVTNPKGRGINLLFWNFFPENCTKLEKNLTVRP